MNKHNTITTKNLTLTALMTAFLCVLAPFAIPAVFSPVPLTFCTLGLYLCILVLGRRKSTISCLLYLFLGMVGLPVFSGFSGGIGRLLGPTGGYLTGYLLLCLIAGSFTHKWGNKWYICLLGMTGGTAVCYLFGSLWLAYQMKIDLKAALAIGALPYIGTDFCKMLLALFISTPLRRALYKAHLL